jgi:MoaA/NifB/PqqE/SkfB family radical SAM enzyme
MRRMMGDLEEISACGLSSGCEIGIQEIPSFLPESRMSDLQRENLQRARDSFHKREMFVSHYPIEIEMILDLFCNLRCLHCSQRRDRNDGALLEMDPSAFSDELEMYLSHAQKLVLLGGEPTVSPKFHVVVSAVRNAKGAKIFLVTNGQLIEREVIPNLDVIMGIQVSVDAASPETYGKIRRGGSWSNLLSGLEELSELRGPREIEFNNVIHPMNVGEMSGMVDLAAQFGGTLIHFEEVRPFASLTPEQMSSFTFSSQDQKDLLGVNLEHARQRAEDLKIPFFSYFPSIREEGPPR